MSTDGFNLLFVIVSMIAILIVAATSLVALLNNAAVDRRARSRLSEQLRKTPLYRMLMAHHIDLTLYESKMPTGTIEEQLQFCGRCSHKQQCEKMLSDPSDTDDDYAFCPNAEVIKRRLDRESAYF